MKEEKMKVLGLEIEKKEFYIIGAIFLALILLGVTGKPFAIAGQETTTTSMGDIVSQPKTGGFSFFSAFFASNYAGKECFIDDNRAAGCSIAGRSVVRYFGELGWSKYQSCAGWMANWGCDPSKCNYINNPIRCSGTAQDSAGVQCHFDSDCSSGKYCDVGVCKEKQVSQCEDYKARFNIYPYKCSEEGVLYVCTSIGWKHIGDCWTRYGLATCSINGQITTDATKLCKFACTTNAQCKTGYECRYNNCIPKTSADVVDEIDQRKDQLVDEITKCEAKGGQVVGNTCVIETPVLQELIPVDLELVNKKVLDTPILGTVVKKTGFGIAIMIVLIVITLIGLIIYKISRRKK